MTWPLSITLGGVTADDYLALLMRLMPDGYSQDEDGPRVTELEAYAHALWIGRGAIDRAANQALLDRVTELIEEWEAIYSLPNDAARTVAERQQRLVLAERSVAGASADRMADAIATVAPLAVVRANKVTEIDAAACDPDRIWQFGVELDDSEWDDPSTRRTLARVLRRIIPARLHPVPRFRVTGGVSGPLDDSQRLYTAEGATWGGSETLDRSVLLRQTTPTEVGSPTNRLVEYGPLSRLEAADLNAIQDQTLMSPCAGAGVADAFATAGDDQASVYFAVSIGTTSEVTIDDSIDWRDRLIWTRIQADSTNDIRPGQAGDVNVPGLSFEELWSSLDGDNGASGGDFIELGGAGIFGLFIYADDTDGSLKMRNSSGSDVRTVVGFCLASPDLGKR